MVRHEIENHFYPVFVKNLYHFTKRIQIPRLLVNRPIVGNIVAVVYIGALKTGRNPNGVYAQLPQISYFGNDTLNVPLAVAVTIAKAPRIYLIKNQIACVHKTLLFLFL